jgi:hypothetical protein
MCETFRLSMLGKVEESAEPWIPTPEEMATEALTEYIDLIDAEEKRQQMEYDLLTGRTGAR